MESVHELSTESPLITLSLDKFLVSVLFQWSICVRPCFVLLPIHRSSMGANERGEIADPGTGSHQPLTLITRPQLQLSSAISFPDRWMRLGWNHTKLPVIHCWVRQKFSHLHPKTLYIPTTYKQNIQCIMFMQTVYICTLLDSWNGLIS